MRTGRLSISRGHRQGVPEETSAPHLSLVPPATGPAPVSAQAELAPQAVLPDYETVSARLTALERLVRLYEIGALSLEEFAAEKALILGERVPVVPVHFVPQQSRAGRKGPSLLGRMLSWWFLPLCLAAGVALSFATQPEATNRLFAQLYRAVVG